LKFHFAAVVGDSQNAYAVYGGGGRAEFRNSGAKVEPGEVDGIDDEKKGDKKGAQASEKADRG